MEDSGSKTEDNILYELLTFAEWNQNSDFGLQKITLNNSVSNTSSYFKPWRILRASNSDNKKFLQTEYAWQLAVSQDGKVVAVLQESLLEIRTAKDEYSSVIGRAQVPFDQCPQLRKLAWSPDNTFLAVARDNGIVNIYNILGCIIATIQPGKKTNSPNVSTNNVAEPVIGLLFMQSKFKSTKWSNELLVIYHNGDVKSILLSSLDGCDSEENANCSLESNFPQGITSVAYHNLHHIILIAGPCHSKEHGISVWRVLNDYPYVKIVSEFEKSNPHSRSFLRFLPGYSTEFSPNTIIKMKISPNGEILACLHLSGEISLWLLPSVRLKARWPLLQQPHYNRTNPGCCESIKDEEYFHPVDISWWSDTALVIARRSGAIMVCSASTLNNLLGDTPEFLSCSPQISSIHCSRSAVIALECEVENVQRDRIKEDMEDNENERETSVIQASIQAALYSFTDIERFEPKRKTPRIVQRTYRLLAIKRTTPEELYARQIQIEDYDSALLLAQTYNLNCDLVYQKQWRSSTVDEESIYNYLDKIKNTFWVLNECIERVPETIESAKELLHFALKKTELDEESRRNLDEDKRKIILLRRQILFFSDNLCLYRKIMDNPKMYNAAEYDTFRKQSAIVNTVTLAREEKWPAVSIMLTFKSADLLKHRLPILSNFPETMPPSEYRSLLPEIIDNEVVEWVTMKLRVPDWSEDIDLGETPQETDSSTEYICESDQSLKRFSTEALTPELVEEWYLKRTYEIEKNTGLVENALSFAKLGKERNVKGLDQLLFNLSTLHTLVYVIKDEEITLSKLEALTHQEQGKLLLSTTTKNTFVNDITNVLYPFSLRCEKQGSTTFYSLLKEIILGYSEESLDLPLELFRCLKEENTLSSKFSMTDIMSLAHDCLYTCPKSDQVDNSYQILECLPVRGTSMTQGEKQLHDKIDRLEKHLRIYDILDLYKTPKSLRFILENEENKDVGIQLMQDMAKYTKNETLDFKALLDDLKLLQTDMYTCVELSFCYELVAYTQMTCECPEIILSADELLQCNKDELDKVIPLDKSIELVLKAAKVHFERATTCDDLCIELSMTCLKLINHSDPQIGEELDLIESLQLLQDFKVTLLPLQVRQCDDKIRLIRLCLEASPDAYTFYNRLLQLAHVLRIYGEDIKRRIGEVLILTAQYALNALDYEYCKKMCSLLVSKNFPPAWSIVRDLAVEDAFVDQKHKKEFLAFAILHCPAENLEELIESSVKISRVIYPKADIKSLKAA